MEVIQPITEGKVQHVPVIMASPSKSSSLDLIPTFLLKEVIDILLTVHNGNLLCNCLAGDAKVTIHQLEACMDDVDAWMKANQLHLNLQKT